MPRRSFDSLREALQASFVMVLILYAVLALDHWILPVPLAQFGIVPRTTEGLIGILVSPLLHADLTHLAANASPLFVLLFLLFWDRRYRPLEALLGIWLLSGLGTWLIGRGDSVHIGASALIYGLVVYLVVVSFWIRSKSCFFVAVAVLLFYGGILAGVLPQDGFISWEAHLSGACGGFLVARVQHSR